MKGWPAVLSALLFFIPAAAPAAEDGNAAARELARKTAAFIGRGEPVSVTWNNVSTLGSSELQQARASFEAALREAGGRPGDAASPVDARVTLSENRTQYLLVEEIRRGEERQVWIASWKRAESGAASIAGITLVKKLAWEQEELMLDVAISPIGMLVLSPSKLTLYTRQSGSWKAAASAPVSAVKAWPRDLRGHLRVNGGGVQAHLPGIVCNGAIDPALTLECRQSDEPWVLESGSRSLLLSYYNAARNHFDGRVMTQAGLRKTLAPFYSAASIDEQGRTLWLVALLDGRTQMLDPSLDPVGYIPAWGSDIAGTDARCGNGSQVLATRPGDSTMTDSVQAFAILNRTAAASSAPMELPGPVSALWTAGASVPAIVRNLANGKYQAYVITLSCE